MYLIMYKPRTNFYKQTMMVVLILGCRWSHSTTASHISNHIEGANSHHQTHQDRQYHLHDNNHIHDDNIISNINNYNQPCTEPNDAHLENLYIKMLSSAEFHESLTQVAPLHKAIAKRVFTSETEDICDNTTTVPNTQSRVAITSLCPWGTVIMQNSARYPRSIREVRRIPDGFTPGPGRHLCDVEVLRAESEDYNCEALVLYIRVLYRTQWKDAEGRCKYVPGWYKQTVAYLPTH